LGRSEAIICDDVKGIYPTNKRSGVSIPKNYREPPKSRWAYIYYS
jgi:hypothetical protein